MPMDSEYREHCYLQRRFALDRGRVPVDDTDQRQEQLDQLKELLTNTQKQDGNDIRIKSKQ